MKNESGISYSLLPFVWMEHIAVAASFVDMYPASAFCLSFTTNSSFLSQWYSGILIRYYQTPEGNLGSLEYAQ